MDFKVAGTRQGVTSIQMDIKIAGLEFKIVSEALEKAKQARLHILDIMDQAIPQPRSQLSKYAPRIITVQIRPDKIGDLIGPKGKTIRGIQEQTGAEINVDDNGLVTISAVGRSEEHTSELQSRLHLVCRLLLEKKKKKNTDISERCLSRSNERDKSRHSCSRV